MVVRRWRSGGGARWKRMALECVSWNVPRCGAVLQMCNDIYPTFPHFFVRDRSGRSSSSMESHVTCLRQRRQEESVATGELRREGKEREVCVACARCAVASFCTNGWSSQPSPANRFLTFQGLHVNDSGSKRLDESIWMCDGSNALNGIAEMQKRCLTLLRLRQGEVRKRGCLACCSGRRLGE